jgi:hypothetical protein
VFNFAKITDSVDLTDFKRSSQERFCNDQTDFHPCAAANHETESTNYAALSECAKRYPPSNFELQTSNFALPPTLARDLLAIFLEALLPNIIKVTLDVPSSLIDKLDCNHVD